MAALAQSTIPGPTAYAGGAPISLTIPVTASVGGRCGFAAGAAPSGTFDAGAIDIAGWSGQFAFTLNCNGAARVAVVSANGGLRTALLPAEAGYLGLAPYSVKLNLVGAAGSTATQTCQVATLVSGASTPCTFVGTASQTNGLRIGPSSQNLVGSYLEVSAPPYAGPGILVQGTYTDTLTVTVSASI
ncbi:MAG: hypothetical protein NTX28_11345 [Novosphingobium sp.]|nr:hypothetical protein [Novosphingobium sp.]